MSVLNDILSMIDGLSAEDRRELKSILGVSDSPNAPDMEGFLVEERFANGRVCPHCGCTHVVRNGHQADGSQRYMCRDCGKSFMVTSNSIVSGTRKDISVWERYVSCMMGGMSLRKTAEICGIHRNTAFNWRHKILDALRDIADSAELDGIVEIDETFFPVSYKGNHSKSKTFAMPREAHRRGKQTRMHGLSREKVCVPCAVNRSGVAVAQASNLGRISTKDIHSVFDGRIGEDATIVTDKMNSYVRFAHRSGLRLVQLKNGKDRKGIYNIQRVNSYHSKLKKFMRNFNGVSTKYLDNYLAWNNFVNYAKETYAEKRSMLLRLVLTTPIRVVCREISSRSPLPVVG